MFGCALLASLRIFECHPSVLNIVGAGAIKGVHVPHAEWVVPFYPGVLEVLQELVPIVKCWSFTLQPPPSQKKKLDEMGHVHFLLDKMGLDKMGLDEMALNHSGTQKTSR